MSAKNMNQAFPSQAYLGMSLRDYFAAKAMQTIAAAVMGMDMPDKPAHIAHAAYVYADAMLRARSES